MVTEWMRAGAGFRAASRRVETRLVQGNHFHAASAARALAAFLKALTDFTVPRSYGRESQLQSATEEGAQLLDLQAVSSPVVSLEREVITRANARIGERVRTVTCPVHRKTYPVSVHGLAIGVLDEPCCKAGIDAALEDAVEQALR